MRICAGPGAASLRIDRLKRARTARESASRWRAEQLARARHENVVDPGEFHEVLTHALAGLVDARDARADRLFDVGMRRVARVTERLRQVLHAEAQVVDAGQPGELVCDLE